MLEDPSHGTWYYWIKVTTANGLRTRVRRGGFATEQAAIDARDKAVMAPSPRVLAQAWTVGKWLTDWIDTVDLRPSTVRGYKSIVTHHLIPILGSHRLADLQTRDVERAMNTIACRPKADGGVIATSTRAGILAVLRSALGDARRQGYIRWNPAFGVKKHKPTRPTAVVWEPERVALWRATGWRPVVAVWDADLLAEFFDKIEDHPLAAVFRLMALCGPRRGEVCCLQGDDFDFLAPYVHITKQMHGSGHKTWIGPPKSPAGVRYAPLDDLTNAMCQDAWCRTVADPRRETLNPRGHVFIQPNGRPVTPDYLTRTFAALVKLHGMPPIRLHDLRHQAASMLGAAGVEPKITQGILGHSSAVTTVDTYWQVFRTLATAAVNASADLLRTHAAKRRHLGAAKLA